MAVSYYNVGTATLTQGSDAMVGQGTLWTGNVRPGDTVVSYTGQTAIVGSVNSNTSITLTRLFRGTSQAALAYDIVFAPADATVAQDVSTVLNAIRSSALVGLSGLVPAARKLPYYDAASAAALTNLTEFARTLLAGASAAAVRATLGAQAALGYTPANTAGDTFSGNVTVNGPGGIFVGAFSASGATDGKVIGNTAQIQISRSSADTRSHIQFYNPNGIVGQIFTNASSTSYSTSSDYRLKQDDEPIAGALDRLNQLRPISFAWRANPAGPRVDGFLAHEVQAVVPEAVSGAKDAEEDVGNASIDDEIVAADIPQADAPDGSTWVKTGTRPAYQAIDQAKLVPLLTAALQAAVAKIEALESRVAALEGE